MTSTSLKLVFAATAKDIYYSSGLLVLHVCTFKYRLIVLVQDQQYFQIM